MTAAQNIVCFAQHLRAAGLRVSSTSPFAVAGRTADARTFGQVLAHLRDTEPATNDLIASIVTAEGIDWEQVVTADGVGPYLALGWTAREEEALERLGSVVPIATKVYPSGRVEGVLPGIVLVTPRPEPLPEEPVAAWQARTERALPFDIDLLHLTAGGAIDPDPV